MQIYLIFIIIFLANKLHHISKQFKSSPIDEPWLDVEQALCNKLEVSGQPFY